MIFQYFSFALYFLIFVIYSSAEPVFNGKLINFVENSNCTASSTFENYYCKNALKPFWRELMGWASNCDNSTNCKQQYINIYFERSYDVLEICLWQRYHETLKAIKVVDVTFNDNNSSSFQVNLDNDFLDKCFLVPENKGFNSTSMKLSIKDTFSNGRNGFRSIMAYAYDGIL